MQFLPAGMKSPSETKNERMARTDFIFVKGGMANDVSACVCGNE